MYIIILPIIFLDHLGKDQWSLSDTEVLIKFLMRLSGNVKDATETSWHKAIVWTGTCGKMVSCLLSIMYSLGIILYTIYIYYNYIYNYIYITITIYITTYIITIYIRDTVKKDRLMDRSMGTQPFNQSWEMVTLSAGYTENSTRRFRHHGDMGMD